MDTGMLPGTPRAGGNMTVLGAVLGILAIAIVGRWLLMGGDDHPSHFSRKPH
jgi:hypothetical protein